MRAPLDKHIELVRATVLVVAAMIGNLYGCATVEPSGGDAGAPANEACVAKVRACVNSCYDIELGLPACTSCCERNYNSCNQGENYSFYACPDSK